MSSLLQVILSGSSLLALRAKYIFTVLNMVAGDCERASLADVYFASVSDSPCRPKSDSTVPLADESLAEGHYLACVFTAEGTVEIKLHGNLGETRSTTMDKYYQTGSTGKQYLTK